MKKLLIYSILTSLLLICSCQSPSFTKDEAFKNLYPGVEFNTSVTLEEDPFSHNSMFLGSEIDLILVNQSNEMISFDISEDAAIYSYSEFQHKWVEINNIFDYRPSDVLLYPKGANNITDALVFVWPEIYDYSEPAYYRIVAIGHIITDSEEKIDTGAYFDVMLIPSK